MLRRLDRRRSVKDFLESVEYGDAIGENAISQQESVEEIDGEEAQVRKTFQQSFRCGVANLRHLRSNEGQSGQTEEEIIIKKRTIWSFGINLKILAKIQRRMFSLFMFNSFQLGDINNVFSLCFGLL